MTNQQFILSWNLKQNNLSIVTALFSWCELQYSKSSNRQKQKCDRKQKCLEFFNEIIAQLYRHCTKLQNTRHSIQIRTVRSTLHSVRFWGFLSKNYFSFKKQFLSSKSLLAPTKQVSTCFEDFMNIA